MMTRPVGEHGRGSASVMMLALGLAVSGCGPAQFPGREGFTDTGNETGTETGELPDLPLPSETETETGEPECVELVNGGNVAINSLEALEALDGVTKIEGNVEITGNFGELPEGLVALRCLEEIDGFVYVHDVDLRDFTGLEALRRIGGYFYVGQTFALESLAGLSALRQIGSYLHLTNNSALQTTSGTDLLIDVGDFVIVNANPLLQDLSGFALLPGLDGQLRIEANGSLTSLAGLEGLRGVGSHLAIVDNFSLSDSSALSNIERVGGNMFWQGNPLITSMQLHSLLTVNGYVFLVDMPALANLDDLYGLYGINNSLVLQYTGLEQIDGLSNLEYLGGDVWIQLNANLVNVDGLSSLVTAYGQVIIDQNAALVSAEGLAALETVATGLSLWGNPNLVAMSLDSLQSVGGYLRIGYSRVQSIPPTPVSTVAGNLMLFANPELTSITGFANLQTLGGNFDLRENPQLETLAFPALTSVFGRIQLIDNDKLRNVNGLSNVSTAQAVNIRENYWLNSVAGLSNLTSVPGMFKLVLNGGLVDLAGLDNLTQVGGDFALNLNGNLVSISGLQGLDAVGGDFTISGNDDLPTCIAQSFAAGVAFVGGGVDISANKADSCGG